jgi:hypothetical protein
VVELEFYDPSGKLEITHNHASRLDTLNGKRIGLLSNEQWQAHRTLPMLQTMLAADFPGIEVLPIDTFPQGEHVVGADSTIAQVKDSGVDGMIIGNAACGSCSTALGRAAAKLEKLDIPTVLLGRSDFLGVVRNAVSGRACRRKCQWWRSRSTSSCRAAISPRSRRASRNSMTA